MHVQHVLTAVNKTRQVTSPTLAGTSLDSLTTISSKTRQVLLARVELVTPCRWAVAAADAVPVQRALTAVNKTHTQTMAQPWLVCDAKYTTFSCVVTLWLSIAAGHVVHSLHLEYINI